MRWVTVYIDDARIPSKGSRWCHMVSDRSFGELHELAARMGLNRRRWHRDHYDVLEEERDRALEMGARPIDRREMTALLPLLRARGLRLLPHQRDA